MRSYSLSLSFNYLSNRLNLNLNFKLEILHLNLKTKTQIANILLFSYLNHVFLYTVRITASQNAQQLVVRDEKESWEGVALWVEVIVEWFLTSLESFRQPLQIRQSVQLVARDLYIWLFGRLSHYLHQKHKTRSPASAGIANRPLVFLGRHLILYSKSRFMNNSWGCY